MNEGLTSLERLEGVINDSIFIFGWTVPLIAWFEYIFV